MRSVWEQRERANGVWRADWQLRTQTKMLIGLRNYLFSYDEQSSHRMHLSKWCFFMSRDPMTRWKWETPLTSVCKRDLRVLTALFQLVSGTKLPIATQFNSISVSAICLVCLFLCPCYLPVSLSLCSCYLRVSRFLCPCSYLCLSLDLSNCLCVFFFQTDIRTICNSIENYE